MSDTDQLQGLADFLWEFLTDQPPSAEEQQQQLTDKLVDALEEAGFRGVSNEQLAEALGNVESRLNEQHSEGLDALSLDLSQNILDTSVDLEESLSNDFDASITQLKAEHIAPLRLEIENMPEPVINQITHRHVTNRTVNNTTNIDDRQVVNTNNVVEDGGVLDQRIVQSDEGAIAIGGDVEDAAVNSGQIDGVQAGGDVDIEDAVVGDANTAILDSDVDNLAVGGDAVSVETAPPEPEPAVEPVIDDTAAADAAAAEAAAAEAAAAEAAAADAAAADAALADAAAAEAAAAEAEAELDV